MPPTAQEQPVIHRDMDRQVAHVVELSSHMHDRGWQLGQRVNCQHGRGIGEMVGGTKNLDLADDARNANLQICQSPRDPRVLVIGHVRTAVLA